MTHAHRNTPQPRALDASANHSAAVSVVSGDWFDKCVIRKKRTTGSLEISCRLGLWSVEGPDHAFVEQNARHYWVQYYRDGEYAALLSNPELTGAERPV